jgi:hypothetical protein
MTTDKPNERDSARRTQLLRYVEAILSGAAEEGVRHIHFIPEADDIVVYFAEPHQDKRRVMSIPIASFAELWRLALAPGFETGQHVMTIGRSRFLFRIREGRMALGEEVTIEISELKPEDGHPLSEEGQAVFHEEPWEKVRTILDSIINLGLDRDSQHIEMRPGDPEVSILYFTRGQNRMRLPISKQTYRQLVHYMREFYFFFGFAAKHFGGRDYIIKPRRIESGDDPVVILDIARLDEDRAGLDELLDDSI